MGFGRMGCNGGGTPARGEGDEEEIEAVVAAVDGRYLEDATDAASESSRADVVRGGGFASKTGLPDAGESGRPE